jgi:3-amino-5-hydroxybenzoate synthase
MSTLAIQGGSPTKQKPFPRWPAYDEQEIAALTSVIESRNWWRKPGEQVAKLEEEFAAYQHARYAIAVTNGTHAIEIALAAAGIGFGDEVIIPAHTFISTASAVLYNNAIPILVDSLPDTYCIDPSAIAAAITPRTKAILPVHMAGHMADMDTILEIAHHHNLVVMEDAAHTPGAEWRGKPAGTLQLAGTYSFQAAKLMTAGEGGMIVTNDEDFRDRCFLLANCGRLITDRSYEHTMLGSNYRMSELHAAVLRKQLIRLDAHIMLRHQNAVALDQMMRQIKGITPQAQDQRVTRHPHYMYMFRYEAAAFGGLSRNDFVDTLIAEGVPAFKAYRALHETPVFRQLCFGPRWHNSGLKLPDYATLFLPVSEMIGSEVVWLPHPVLLGDQEDLEQVVKAICKIQKHYA